MSEVMRKPDALVVKEVIESYKRLQVTKEALLRTKRDAREAAKKEATPSAKQEVLDNWRPAIEERQKEAKEAEKAYKATMENAAQYEMHMNSQPGADELNQIGLIYLKWVRGDVDSSDAIFEIGQIVGGSEYFDFEGI